MNTPRQTRHCPDCDGSLHEIRVVAASQHSLLGEGSFHMDVSYAAPDAQPSLFTRRIPLSGRISGLVCDCCKRVFFYALGEVPEVVEEEDKSDPQNW